MPTIEERTEPADENIPRTISFPAGNDDFRKARNACARACQLFNETPDDAPSDLRCKRWLDIVDPNRAPSTAPAVTLSETFSNPSLVPAAPFVKPPINMDYGLRVRVGGSTFINRYCMIMDTPVADVAIGERCNIGPHCNIISVGHPLGVLERTTKRASTGRGVWIGDGVWIGARVTIMGGVTIGEGSVIGACSLVTRSIPPRALAYGNPAEVIKILDEDEKADLDRDDEGTVDTLEEALKLRSREPTPPPPSASTHVATKSAAAAAILDRPGRDHDRSQQQHLGGVRDSHGLTRAEILALVALAVSFMGCFFFVALLVVTRWEGDASLPRVGDL